MNSIQKNPDRIFISKKAKDIVKKIDSEKFINLDTSNNTRAKLFDFAMAIGIETLPIKMESVGKEGFLLESSIDGRKKALMYSYIISNSKDKETLDEVTDKAHVYGVAQDLANTGFEIIEDYISNSKEELLLWKMIKELDEQYTRNVNNDFYENNNDNSSNVAENDN